METPIEVTFEHVPHSDAVETRVREEFNKVERVFGRLTSARVVVARPQHRHHKGDAYDIRIHMCVPGAKDVIVSRKPGQPEAHTDVYLAIRDAFAAGRRQLQDLADLRNKAAKSHSTRQPPPDATTP